MKAKTSDLEAIPSRAFLSHKPIPAGHVRYRTLWIKPKLDFGEQGFLIDGEWVKTGFIVCNDHCEIMPGAAWFRTVEKAKHAIDILVAVRGNAEMFWELMRPFQYTPGDKIDPSSGFTDGVLTCGRYYAVVEGGVVTDVGVKSAAASGPDKHCPVCHGTGRCDEGDSWSTCACVRI